MRRPELLAALLLASRLAAAETEPAPAPAASSSGLLGLSGARSKGPITITADTLEYEYKVGVIVYRGTVVASQGDVKIRSNELRITLAKSDEAKGGDEKTGTGVEDVSAGKLRAVVASGDVRIDQGTRWAVGGKATFDQTNRTLVLTESPVLHDGPNEVAGERVVVYLDQDRSVVEGGRKRVKAVLFPGKDDASAARAPRKEPAR